MLYHCMAFRPVSALVHPPLQYFFPFVCLIFRAIFRPASTFDLWDLQFVIAKAVSLCLQTQGAAFSVLNDSLDKTASVLTSAGLITCFHGTSCTRIPYWFAKPPLHMHMDDCFPDVHADAYILMEFWTQSQILWELPAFSSLPAYPTKEVTHVSSSARWGPKGKSVSDDVLWLPSLALLVRAWALLAVRVQVDKGDERDQDHWLQRFTTAMEVLPEKGLWNEKVEKEVMGNEDLKLMIDWCRTDKVGLREALEETVKRVKKTWNGSAK